MTRTMHALLAVMVLLTLCSCQVEDLTGAFSKAVRHGESLSQASQDFTPEQEYYLGRAVAAQILSRYPAINNNAANAYLNKLGQALAMHSTQPSTFAGYHFMLLDSDEVNAFAAPSGFIFVTRGMVALTSGESEMAAVLAHEISHVQNRDAVDAIKASRRTAVFTQIGRESAGQYAPVVPGSELLSLFSDSVDDIVNTLVVNGYSRGQEYDADAGGQQILIRAGYDPHALENVLITMSKRVHSGSGGFGSTHPAASDRLKKLHAADSSTLVTESAARIKRFNTALGRYSASTR